MMLAQLETVPAEIFKWTIIILIGLLGVTATIIGIISFARKNKVTIDSQPVEVRKAAKRFNHELSEQRHGDVTRRLDSHEAEIDSLWNAVRVDIPAMERRLNDAGEDRSSAIHERINVILAKVSELSGRLK